LVAGLLPFAVLLDPAVLLPLLALVSLPAVFPWVAVLLLLAGFLVWSVVDVEVCGLPATPAPANSAVIAANKATATAPLEMLRTFITALLVFQPTHPL
jgi:1-acyl-sn-glycerol-3-phosphate acyltransferase